MAGSPGVALVTMFRAAASATVGHAAQQLAPALTVLQYPFPEVRTALWRAPGSLAAGRWWRLDTALFVQYDAVWQIEVVFACIAVVGVLASGSSGMAGGCCCTWAAA